MKVLEISTTPAAAYAGLLLTQLGIEVHRVDRQHELTGFEEAFLLRDRPTIDVNDIDVARYDGVIEDIGPKRMQRLGLAKRRINAAAPACVLVSLSALGRSGPMSDWDTSELVTQAMGGVMHVNGYDGEAPQKLPGNTSAMILGIHGATAMVAAVYGVQTGNEEAVHLDISAQDALMLHWTRHISQYAYAGTKMGRQPRAPKGIHARHTAMAKDGYVYMLALRTPWQDIANFLGLQAFTGPEHAEGPQPWDAMEGPFHESLASRTRYEWFAAAAEHGWTFAPVEDPFTLECNPQSQARGAFVDVDYEGASWRMPALPFRCED